jgi:hypothetical protein
MMIVSGGLVVVLSVERAVELLVGILGMIFARKTRAESRTCDANGCRMIV